MRSLGRGMRVSDGICHELLEIMSACMTACADKCCVSRLRPAIVNEIGQVNNDESSEQSGWTGNMDVKACVCILSAMLSIVCQA